MKKIWLIFVLLLSMVFTAYGFCEEDGVEVEIVKDGAYNPAPEPQTMLLTGSLSYNIPISVPDGRAGIEPDITIGYNNYAKDDLLGIGWRLTGLGSISRSTKWGLSYDDHNFEADDQELVPWLIDDESGDGEYRAQINERFERYEFSQSSGWVVTEKNGTKYSYGTDVDSREENDHGVFAWYLCRIEDPNGNFLRVSYFNDQGRLYPNMIEYTGNSTAQAEPTYKVRFHYEPRADVSTSYATHSKVVTAQRLMSITVWSADNLVRAYKIDYDNSLNAPLNTSYLSAVTEYGSDAQYDADFRITGGSSLPPVKAQYTTVQPYKNTPFHESSGSSVLEHLNYQGKNAKMWQPLDYDGDGAMELVTASAHGGWISGCELWIYDLINESAFSGKAVEVSPREPTDDIFDGEAGPNISDFYPADFNGDGKADIIVYLVKKVLSNATHKTYRYVHEQKLCLSNGDGTFNIIDVEIGKFQSRVPTDRDRGTRNQKRFEYGDFNGDGRTDIYFQYDYYWSLHSGDHWRGARSDGWMIYLAKDSGDGFDLVASYEDGDSWTNRYNQPYRPLTTIKNYTTGDFNGDGRTDLIQHGWVNGRRKDGYDVKYFTGDGFETAYHGAWPSWGERLVPGDYNGDGKTDLLVAAITDELWHGCKLLLATGNGFVESSSLDQPSYDAHIHPADFNGDGRTDFLAVPRTKHLDFYTDWPGYKIYLSKGDEFELVIETNSPDFSYGDPSLSRYEMIAADFNGDNFSDFLSVKFTGGNYYQGDSTGLRIAQVSEYAGPDKDMALNLPNLLGHLDNGRGGRHRFVYRPSSMYDNYNLDFVKPVISQTTATDGTGNQTQTSYEYWGGYYKRETRDFLGFKRVVKTFNDDRCEETYYHQDNGHDSASVNTALMNQANIPSLYADEPLSYYRKGKVMSRIFYEHVYFVHSDSDGDDGKISQTDYDWNVDEDPPPGDGPNSSYFVSLGSETTSEYQHGFESKNSLYLKTHEQYFYDWPQGPGNLIAKSVSPEVQEQEYGPDLDYDAETITTSYQYKNCNPADWLWRSTLESIEGTDSGLARQVNYDYDIQGNLILELHTNTSADSPTLQYSSADYDEYGNRWIERDFKGNETRYTYDSATHSKVETATNPKEHVETFYYHPLYGTIEYQQDPNDNYTKYLYDAFGRVESIETYDPSDTLQAKTQQVYQFQKFPNFIKKSVWEDPEGSAVADSYRYFDGLGRLIQTVTTGESGQYIVNRTVYDDMGRVRDTYGPYFSADDTEGILYEIDSEAPHTWTKSFDWRDRPEEVLTADQDRNLRTVYRYSGLLTNTHDPDGIQKTTVLDGHGRTDQIMKFFDGVGAATTYTYNAAGDLLTITDANSQVTTIGVNTLGQKISLSDPDLGDWQYRYDLNGNLEWQKDAQGHEIEFAYDSLNRLESKTYLNPGPHDHDVTKIYDNPEITQTNPLGHLSQETNSQVSTAYTDYDAQDKLIAETKTIKGDRARTTIYTYDLAGKPVKTVYPDDHEVNIEYYPGSGLIQRVWSPAQDGPIDHVTYQDYPATGKIHQATFHNGVQTTYDYLLYSNRLAKIRTHLDDKDYIHREYTYTAAGDIDAINDIVAENTRFFTYDMHRLTSEYGSSDDYADQTFSIMDYTYDPDKPYHGVGSITQTTRNKRNGSSQSASHDFSYDANGNLEAGVDLKNPVRPSTRSIIYNADNMPVQINHSSKGVTRLYYDSAQTRAKKTASAGRTYYINKFFEVTPKGEVKYIFAGNNRVAVIKPHGTFYIHTDHLSSATVITDKNGKVVDQADYLPYGDQREDEIDLIDYQFTDQEKDTSTGLYNYDARLYDPVIGRFISADSIVPDWYNPQALDRYAYVKNNPISWVDPSGNYWTKTDTGYQEFVGPSTVENADRDEKLSSLYYSTAGYRDRWNNKVQLGYIPLLTQEKDRYNSIIKNTPAIFPISENPNAASSSPYYQLGFMSDVNKYDSLIKKSSISCGVDSDLVRSIMYLETTHGYYDVILSIFDKNSSILPMNVQTPKWDALGTSRAELKNPEININIGTKLISRIQSRLLDPTPAKIGTLYNSLAKEKVSDYGGRLNYYYATKPWKR